MTDSSDSSPVATDRRPLSSGDSAPARETVALRPIGTPMPVGLFGLAAATLVSAGFELGWVPPTQRLLVGVVLLGFPVALQLLASVLSFLARDGVAGSGLGVLSTTWLVIGAVYVISPPGSTSAALGLLLLVAAAALVLSAGAASLTKLVPAAVFLVSGVRFALTGLHQLTASVAWREAAGIVGLILAALALYTAFALELEGTLGRTVLPLLRRGVGQRAVGGSLSEQLEGVEAEAGVRKAL
jgi:succinate-acetate transporter protein